MLITQAVESPTFANHESFHLRYGWLKKAYDQVGEDDRIFTRDDATVRLGVGKNMVRAIKFWSMASKVVEARGPTQKAAWMYSDIGHAIFGKRGLDPYLEMSDTVWLLHWLLFAPPCRIPVWWIIMNEFTATNVKIEDLTEAVMRRVTNIPRWKTPNIKSVKKDIDVFIHTYSTRQDKLPLEDFLDCPFRQICLIRQGSRDSMRFVLGKKQGMSPLIVAFACLDFIRRSGIASKSVSVSRLAAEAGSVGNTFKLGENDLGEMLREACGMSKSIRISNINGSPHLSFESPEKAAMDVLSQAYGKKVVFPKMPKTETLSQAYGRKTTPPKRPKAPSKPRSKKAAPPKRPKMKVLSKPPGRKTRRPKIKVLAH